jgi:hypothetical protein
MTERTFLPIFSQIIPDECYVNLTMIHAERSWSIEGSYIDGSIGIAATYKRRNKPDHVYGLRPAKLWEGSSVRSSSVGRRTKARKLRDL